MRIAVIAGVAVALCACRESPVSSTPAPVDGGLSTADVTDDRVALDDTNLSGDEWMPTPIVAECAVYQANPTTIPARSWTTCGPRCISSDVQVAGRPKPRVSNTTLGWRDGDALLAVESPRATGLRLLVERLSEPRVLLALEQRGLFGKCAFVPPTASSVAAGAYVTRTSAGPSYRVYDMSGATVRWGDSWIASPSSIYQAFGFVGGYGWTFADDSVRIVRAAEATLRTLDGVSPAAYAAAVMNDLVVWSSRVSGKSSLVAWRSAWTGGPQTVMTMTDWIAGVAVSSDSVVWTSGTGSSASVGHYDTTAFNRLKAWSDAGARSPTTVPLPAQSNLRRVVTNDDYSAARGCGPAEDKSCKIYVIQWSTGSVFAIPDRPASVFVDAVGLTRDQLILAEDAGPSDGVTYQRLVRVDIANIAKIAGEGW